MPVPNPPVITRFAPSPTGHLHIGGARTALFCWAFARKNNGHFTLRIEDTDQARSSDESARGIMEDLAWLGIEWDEGPELKIDHRSIGGDPRGGVGPFFQARRVHLYNKYITQLIEQGKAYPAFEKPDELDAKRKAAVAAKQTYRYDRAALSELPDVSSRLKGMATGEPHVVRLLWPDSEIVVHDQVLGDVRYARGEGDDFVIRKADGFPTYHFAVVVDDETMGITHVLRAQEHLNNTPRHVALQMALGFRTPVYAHMPLIFNMDGTKMSKRDKAKAARKFLSQAIDVIEHRLKGPLVPQLQKVTGLSKAQLVSAIVAIMDEQQDPQRQTDPLMQSVEIETFRVGDSDSIAVASAVATYFGISLPEIEVSDFRAAGYLPEAICNFLSLLGWNPGLKTADGKDLEKFDRQFLADNFSIDRIGKTNAKFDRAKLLSFNADYINAMTDQHFADRWQAWCGASTSPEQSEGSALLALSPQQWLWLARAIKPRAKTLRDALKSAAFLSRPDTSTDFDKPAVEKQLLANDRAGLAILRDFAALLPSINPFDPDLIHAALESLARDKGLVTEKGPNIGPIAAPIRIAIAGVPVTPPLGETLAILGRASVTARIAACLKAFAA